MHAKSFRRAIILAVALVASTLTLVTGTTTAAHATAYTSFSQLQSNYSGVRYGSSITLTGRVGFDDAHPTYVDTGTATLQRLAYGSSTWANFSTKTIDSSTEDMTWTFKPSNTTQYRIVYSGGTSGADTFSATTSNVVKISVSRNLHDNFRRATRTFYGKVAPKYAGRAIVIQKSTCARPATTSCRWSTYKTIKTNSTSNFSLRLPVYRTKTHFRAVIAASNGYVKSFSNYYVSTWRS